MAPATSRAARAWALYRSQRCSAAANRIFLYIGTSPRSPSAEQCVPGNGEVLGMSSSSVLSSSLSITTHIFHMHANPVPKGAFLPNLVPMLSKQSPWPGMVCELHASHKKEAVLIVVSQPLQGQ